MNAAVLTRFTALRNWFSGQGKPDGPLPVRDQVDVAGARDRKSVV